MALKEATMVLERVTSIVKMMKTTHESLAPSYPKARARVRPETLETVQNDRRELQISPRIPGWLNEPRQ